MQVERSVVSRHQFGGKPDCKHDFEIAVISEKSDIIILLPPVTKRIEFRLGYVVIQASFFYEQYIQHLINILFIKIIHKQMLLLLQVEKPNSNNRQIKNEPLH
jgi:hypothetical protein